MKYRKPPLSLEQQADQLLARGMVGDRDLLDEFSDIPLGDMGFPANWEECTIWTQPKETNHG